MKRLPSELLADIFGILAADSSRSTRLSTMLTCKTAYRRIVPSLYNEVTLTTDNATAFFHGLGEVFRGSPPPRSWPVSGPGLTPLCEMGLSIDPDCHVTPFIRKFALCNMVRSLVITDTQAFTTLLRAGGVAWVSGMDTWRQRVLFDQIDCITFLPAIFDDLDSNPLGLRCLLGEIWNVIKGDAVYLHFPEGPLKLNTYSMALAALAAPGSIGQRGRLLGEVVVRTPTVEGINLWQIGASRLRICLCRGDTTHLNDDEHGRETIRGGTGLQAWLKKWFTPPAPDQTLVPPELERVEVYNVPPALCIPLHSQIRPSSMWPDVREIPRLLYKAFDGDEELAGTVAQRVKVYDSEMGDDTCLCCGL
ncbi:hypothetical protein IAU60_001873 [Kwoniella sp. DSM 27419]